ncbi:MmcQ/YjbR family DNA-binding protein [Devosia lacusdianchii]|uniref:MmcQ/YjbR family DNA-binding protein n=1 Tax=Devosia lacusdianchii TaxID=2917991 RepID=UPI001F057552|nr:MmcQ/YjbR family DNA-binding protein [Devosia sp. JXJ CY 41]
MTDIDLFTVAAFDAFAAALEGSSLHDQWGARLAKVNRKIFATHALAEDGLAAIIFKCPPEAFEGLTALLGVAQAPYFPRGHWVRVSATVDLAQIDLTACVARSHGLVAGKRASPGRQTR